MEDAEWQVACWEERIFRHRPSNNVEWQVIVKQTGDGKKPRAMYMQGLTLGRQRIMEMGAVVDGLGMELPRDKRATVRRFVQQFDEIIGASLGEQTTWMLVEYHQAGAVHGRPVLLSELKGDLP